MKFALIVLIFCLALPAIAQEQDTTRVRISEEVIDPQDPNFVLVPKYKSQRFSFNERSLLRFELGLDYPAVRESYQSIDFKSTIAALSFEQKLWGSPFSVKASIIRSRVFDQYGRAGTWSQLNQSASSFTGEFGEINFQMDLEFRFYYNQKGKIRRGESGNNLNGPFVALISFQTLNHVDYFFQESEFLNNGFSRVVRTEERKGFKSDLSLIGLVWGYQQRFFNRIYAEAKVGLSLDTDEEQNISELIGQLRIGVALWKK